MACGAVVVAEDEGEVADAHGPVRRETVGEGGGGPMEHVARDLLAVGDVVAGHDVDAVGQWATAAVEPSLRSAREAW